MYFFALINGLPSSIIMAKLSRKLALRASTSHAISETVPGDVEWPTPRVLGSGLGDRFEVIS